MADFSITRALNELKLLDARINRAISEGSFITFQVGNGLINNQLSPELFAQRAKESLQSAADLIARRNEVKSKIVASNAMTWVTIAGKPYTVADAIERKTSIAYDKSLLNQIRGQFVAVNTKVNQENAQVKARLDKNIESMLGKDLKDKAAEVEALTNSFNQSNQAKIVDPLDVKTIIDNKVKEIEDFANEVDFILSESNTRTIINLA